MEFPCLLVLAMEMLTPLLLLFFIQNACHTHLLIRIDRNKKNAPMVPTSSGIFLLPAVISFLPVFLGNFGSAIAIAVLIAGLIGLVDDLKGVGIWVKVPLMMLPSIPVILYLSIFENEISNPPFLAFVPIVFLAPFITSFFSNAFNILSGYDGLSTGIGVIQIGVLASLAFISGKIELLAASLLLLPPLSTIFIFNWFPAKLFPGNSGTFITGTLTALLFVYGNFWLALFVVFIPHIAEFVMKLRFRGNSEVFGTIDENGKITYSGKPKSIVHFLLLRRHWLEFEISSIFLCIEFVLGLGAVFIYYLFSI
ncbi:MAG: hypothetical protein ACP5JR_07860 [Thermoplasmata archaeon]